MKIIAAALLSLGLLAGCGTAQSSTPPTAPTAPVVTSPALACQTEIKREMALPANQQPTTRPAVCNGFSDAQLQMWALSAL